MNAKLQTFFFKSGPVYLSSDKSGLSFFCSWFLVFFRECSLRPFASDHRYLYPPSLLPFSPPVMLVAKMSVNQRDFGEAIRVNLMDISVRERSPHTGSEVPPSRFKGYWNRQDLAKLAASGSRSDCCLMLGLSQSALVTPTEQSLFSSTVLGVEIMWIFAYSAVGFFESWSRSVWSFLFDLTATVGPTGVLREYTACNSPCTIHIFSA